MRIERNATLLDFIEFLLKVVFKNKTRESTIKYFSVI